MINPVMYLICGAHSWGAAERRRMNDTVYEIEEGTVQRL